jgi:hypothetical protein
MESSIGKSVTVELPTFILALPCLEVDIIY